MNPVLILVCSLSLLLPALRGSRAADITCNTGTGNPCQCTFKDPLNNNASVVLDISHYFKYPYAVTSDDPTKYEYIYDCADTQCPHNTSHTGVACQYVKSQKAVYSLGKVSSATTWVINNAEPSQFKFTIHYKGGDPTGDQGGDGERNSKIVFAYSKASMSMKVTSETNGQYNMDVTGELVKKSSSSSHKSSSGGSIAGPIGIVVIVLAIVGLVTYFVVGGVYMYHVKGARGVEVVPNVAFWKDFPFLIKDGFLFTISPCYKRNEKYENL